MSASGVSHAASPPLAPGAYAGPLLEALADLVPGARLLIAAGSGRFARSVADGARRAAERLGMNVVGTVPHADVPDDPTKQVDVLLAAGRSPTTWSSFVACRASPLSWPPSAPGSGGSVRSSDPGPEGVVGPSQWEEGVRFRADVGPRGADVIRSLRAALLH